MLTLLQLNDPAHFHGCGSIPYVFTGSHSFRFDQSTTITGGTKFTQEEHFSGALSFLIGDNVVGRRMGLAAKTLSGWERYNQDLKKSCEGIRGSQL